jgi:hypothetical protein
MLIGPFSITEIFQGLLKTRQISTLKVGQELTTDFNKSFNYRLHAFLEDITNQVPREEIRASGRDALAVFEYTFAVIESYERGGEVVRPNPLPPLKGDPLFMK